MIYSTATVPVNPEAETKLTRAQARAGLELKACDARLFLPPGLCTQCDVVEESATHFVREAPIAGVDLREIITSEPEARSPSFRSPARVRARSSTNCSRAPTAPSSSALAALARAGDPLHRPLHVLFRI